MVYSSDMTSISCYSMAPIVTPNPIIMTTLTMFDPISSIYGPSSVTFVNDTDSYTTDNIN